MPHGANAPPPGIACRRDRQAVGAGPVAHCSSAVRTRRQPRRVPREFAGNPAPPATSIAGWREQLLQEVRREARGSHLCFKGAVASVADAARVSPGLLGMIAAYALTEVGQDKDRWGSATNLARPDGSGCEQGQRLRGSSFHQPDSTQSTYC